SSFLAIDNLLAESSFTKQITEPYEQIIRNWADVVEALTDSPFAQLLEDSPPIDRCRASSPRSNSLASNSHIGVYHFVQRTHIEARIEGPPGPLRSV